MEQPNTQRSTDSDASTARVNTDTEVEVRKFKSRLRIPTFSILSLLAAGVSMIVMFSSLEMQERLATMELNSQLDQMIARQQTRIIAEQSGAIQLLQEKVRIHDALITAFLETKKDPFNALPDNLIQQ